MTALRSWLLCVLVASPAFAAPRVLLLWDERNEQTAALAKALTASGAEVVYSETRGSTFNGDNPSLKGFDVVVHLNGTTWQEEMPASGQRSLVAFVKAGGGYVHHEWNAYQLSVGQNQELRPIILFDRTSGYQGPITIKKVDAAAHPVVWEVPKSFTMTGGCNIGHVHAFDASPAVVLARDDRGSDAIAVRELGLGRVVGFHHAGNWVSSKQGATILDASEARRLFVDGVRWAYGCDPGFREGRRDKVCAEIAKSRGR